MVVLHIQAAEQQVTTQGQAAIQTTLQAARTAAIAEAQRAATDLVLGAIVTAETQVANYELVRDTIVRRSGGLARLVSVQAESQKDGIYTVRATFAVSKEPLAQQIRALLDRTGDPRVLVLLPETLAGQPNNSSTAEALLSTALQERGFRVLDPSQTERLTLREQALADPKVARDVASRFGADLIVTGTAVAEPNAVVPEALKSAGLLSYTAKLNVKVVDAITGQQLFNQVLTGAGTGASPHAAGQMALQRAVGQVETPVASRIIDWLAGTGPAARRTFTVRVSGFPSYRAYSAWLQGARTAPQFSTVSSRTFDAAGTEVQIEFGGSADALADLLEGMQLTVTGVTGTEIRATYRP
ncbi:hypothetical protein QOL99_08370 [Deinococcus sp. MIMF12]|uniref:Flagellar assembly protein T N-terminal domain-containing protein n=1 Tax=Deinococcus rhizophilus TaxID=3049544 RepID=A0ABT7JGI0_9DEIO|nr:hypothetical protein [Deinococcus rhizophilus]MDL2344166.1 hypothetical protein [Deinococcus rhizophilus]